MTDRLWAPWRMEHIQSADDQPECVFCRATELDDEAGLIVHRSDQAFVLLNRFPYSSGHLMVVPFRHVGEFSAITEQEALEIHFLASAGMEALRVAMRPEGFNIGWNLGRVAGAGIVGHVHLHLVPRWAGDTNFMPVLADVKVMPEALTDSRRKLAAAWPDGS